MCTARVQFYYCSTATKYYCCSISTKGTIVVPKLNKNLCWDYDVLLGFSRLLMRLNLLVFNYFVLFGAFTIAPHFFCPVLRDGLGMG